LRCLVDFKRTGGEGGLKPQPFRKPRSTREIDAIAFNIANFQTSRVKRREVRRSPKKPKKSRKTVAHSSLRAKSAPLDCDGRIEYECKGRLQQFRAPDLYLDTVEVWGSSSHGPTIPFNDLRMRSRGWRRIWVVACAITPSAPPPEMASNALRFASKRSCEWCAHIRGDARRDRGAMISMRVPEGLMRPSW